MRREIGEEASRHIRASRKTKQRSERAAISLYLLVMLAARDVRFAT